MRLTEKIVDDFRLGKIDSFYKEVYPSLLVFASRQLGTDYAFLAEDCVQDAIYKMYGIRERFSNAAHFKAYLFAAIHNKAVSVLRRGQSRQHYLQEKEDFDEDLQASIIEQETLDLLYEAIDKLPGELHRIFNLSFVEGLKNDEVAKILGCSIGTVKNRKTAVINFLKLSIGEPKLLLLLAILY